MIVIQVPISGESCYAHYDQGKYKAKKIFRGSKFTFDKDGYPKESGLPRCVIRVLLLIKP